MAVQESPWGVTQEPPVLGGHAEVDTAWAQRVADRLRGEFRALLEALPECRTPAAVAKRLRLQPPMCYRLNWGIVRSGDAAQTLGTLPGVEGLRKVLAAARRVNCPPERLAAAAAAVEEFAALIQRHGGSQTKLVALLSGSGPGRTPAGARMAGMAGMAEAMQAEPPTEATAARRMAFIGLCATMGCRAEATVAVRVYAESAVRAGRLDSHAVVGKLGFTRERHGVPLVFGHTSVASNPDTQVSRLPAPSGRAQVLEAFSSMPTPRVQVEHRENSVLYVVDPEQERPEPLDLVVGPMSSMSASDRPARDGVLNSGMVLSTPSRWLLSDVYVPRALMREVSVDSGVYSMAMLGRLLTSPTQRWFDRLPGGLPVMLLGRGLGGADSPLYPRHRALTEMLFAHCGLDPEGFVGLRLAVEYPLAGMQYVISLSADEAEGPAGG